MPKDTPGILESAVEDAFVSNIEILKQVLSIESSLRLIGRQVRLQAGDARLDLLLMRESEIVLVEIKVGPFRQQHLSQIVGYREELERLQRLNQFVAGPITSCLLVTGFGEHELERCQRQNVSLVNYSPTAVMTEYYASLQHIAPFLKLRPVDLGVFNIGLVNRIISHLFSGLETTEELQQVLDLSKISLEHLLRFSLEIGLTTRAGNRYYLTDLGRGYFAWTDPNLPGDALSEQQATLLREHIAKDPFFSPIIFGIYAIVESTFFLARNSYPIELEDLQVTFRATSGKKYEWRSKRAVATATYTYLNYAIKLGLLGRIGRQIVITPAGFRFILMLQLHKSIEMVESLNKTG